MRKAFANWTILWTLILTCALIVVGTSGCSRQDTARTDSQTGETQQQSGQVQVSQIDLGRSVDTDKRITDRTESFHPAETIYASVITSGASSSAEITARWVTPDGQVIDESTQVIAPTGTAATEFHVSKPDGFPEGRYRVEVFLNGAPAGTKEFEVRRS